MTGHEAAAAIQGVLEPGEQALWSGVPRQGVVFHWVDAILIPAGLLWSAFSIVWLTLAVRSGAPSPLLIPGVVFAAFGVYVAGGRFLVQAAQRAGTCYGVTDRRVLVVSGVVRRRVHQAALAELPVVKFHERADGSGYVDFGVERRFAPALILGGLAGPRRRLRFEDVPGVRSVHGVIREAQASASGSVPDPRSDEVLVPRPVPPVAGPSSMRSLQQTALDIGWRIPLILPGEPGKTWRPRGSPLPLVGVLMFLGGIVLALALRKERQYLGIVLAVAGIVFAFTSIAWWERARRRHWVRVEADCIDRELGFWNRKNRSGWAWRVVCRYERDGKEYTVTPKIHRGFHAPSASSVDAAGIARKKEEALAFLESCTNERGRMVLYVNPAEPLECDLLDGGTICRLLYRE
jgi:hypothetical protein